MNLPFAVLQKLKRDNPRYYSRRELTDKEIDFLCLAISQAMEQLYTQKLRYEQFEELRTVILKADRRARSENLPTYVADILNIRSDGNIEVEKNNDLSQLRIFLKYLIDTNIAKKLTLEQATLFLERLEQGHKFNAFIPEFKVLIDQVREPVVK